MWLWNSHDAACCFTSHLFYFELFGPKMLWCSIISLYYALTSKVKAAISWKKTYQHREQEPYSKILCLHFLSLSGIFLETLPHSQEYFALAPLTPSMLLGSQAHIKCQDISNQDFLGCPFMPMLLSSQNCQVKAYKVRWEQHIPKPTKCCAYLYFAEGPWWSDLPLIWLESVS